MYIRQREENYDPEEKSISPFSALGLLQVEQRKYRKKQPELNLLHPFIVFINILLYQKTENGRLDMVEKQGRIGISMDDLLYKKNGPGKVLHLSRTTFHLYLDKLSAEEYLDINRTAGLDMVYLKPEYLDVLQIAQDYYRNREIQRRMEI